MATEYKTVGQAMDGLKETVGNKLTPAFDVLSQVGINAVSGISDALGGIDAQALANGVKSAVDTVGQYIDVLKTSFDGVGTEVGDALKAVGDALGITNTEFNKTEALDKFKSTCESVASGIKTVANFIEEHADTIAKVMPWVLGLVGAFAGFKVLNSVAPGLSSFVGGLALMAAQGIAGLGSLL
jgi:phage-related protein